MGCWTGLQKRSGAIPDVTFHKLVHPPSNLLGFGLGAGMVPFAPGTWGSLVGVAAVWALSGLPDFVYLVVTLACFLSGIVICRTAADSLDAHDHPAIVWDEIVGMMVAMALIEPNALNLLLGFGLFRLFDILKPWPIRQIDRKIQGGTGIMLDDAVAGILANISLSGLLYYLL